MANKANFKFRVEGQPEQRIQKRPMTIEQAIEFVKSRNIDSDVKAEIIKRLSLYPSNAVGGAIRNLSLIVSEVTEKLRKNKKDVSEISETKKEEIIENNEEPKLIVEKNKSSNRPVRKKGLKVEDTQPNIESF